MRINGLTGKPVFRSYKPDGSVNMEKIFPECNLQGDDHEVISPEEGLIMHKNILGDIIQKKRVNSGVFRCKWNLSYTEIIEGQDCKDFLLLWKHQLQDGYRIEFSPSQAFMINSNRIFTDCLIINSDIALSANPGKEDATSSMRLSTIEVVTRSLIWPEWVFATDISPTGEPDQHVGGPVS